MTRKLVLVDYENRQRSDLSLLDETYRAIVFVGARQERPKAARKPATAHRFQRVDFQKVDGTGRNALDFYIAFHLGRTLETAPDTECYVLSGDKGFDPLLVHANRSGLKCRRIEAISELVPVVEEPTPEAHEAAVMDGPVVCRHCGKSSTIEHHGGLWCSNCGRFAAPPDPALLPSNQSGFREAQRQRGRFSGFEAAGARERVESAVRLVPSTHGGGRRHLRRRGVDVLGLRQPACTLMPSSLAGPVRPAYAAVVERVRIACRLTVVGG